MAEWLLHRGRNRFGLIAQYLLLSFATILAVIPFEFASGVPNPEPVTVFSWLPHALLHSPLFFMLVRIWLLTSVILWASFRGLPWSSWSTVVSFTLLWSLRMENSTNGAHIFVATNTLLFVHAMWFQWYGRELKAQLGSGELWQSPSYPRWVFLLSVFYLGWFHTLAGIAKVMSSGWAWGDGLSLQLWVHLLGWHPSPFAQLILSSRTAASILQTGALALECLSVLCVVHRWLRYLIGLGLLGFYVGVLGTFVDFGFHFNAALVALYLLPCERQLRTFS